MYIKLYFSYTKLFSEKMYIFFYIDLKKVRISGLSFYSALYNYATKEIARLRHSEICFSKIASTFR